MRSMDIRWRVQELSLNSQAVIDQFGRCLNALVLCRAGLIHGGVVGQDGKMASRQIRLLRVSTGS